MDGCGSKVTRGVFQEYANVFYLEIVVESDLLGRFAEFGRLENGVGGHTGVPYERGAAHFAWNNFDHVTSGPIHRFDS
jgi:hypothetical protein